MNKSSPTEQADAVLSATAKDRIGSSSIFNFLRHHTDALQAYSILRVVFPRLESNDDGVFIVEHLADDNLRKFQEKGVRGQALERVINHVHLWDTLKDTPGAEMFQEAILELIEFAWNAWIPAQTGRDVRVERMTDTYGPTITFVTKRP
jgi:hypothetical protein